MQVERPPHLVLVGGGHAHVQVMLLLATSTLQVTLISDSPLAYYSGMLPGCVAGQYAEKDIYIDLARFSEWCKVRLVTNRCVGLDPIKRVVFTDDGRELSYDVISFNVGSINRGATERGVREHALCTRPISALTAKLAAFQESNAKNTPHRVLVVGGGAAGVELAFAVHKRLSPCQLMLVTAAPDIIAERSWWTRSVVSSKMRSRGIEILTGRRCTEVKAQSALLDNGKEISTDLVLWATGAAPSSLLAKLRVPLCDQGWIKSVQYPNVFAAGDCCTVEGCPSIAKAGVFSVREGPVLTANIIALLKREALSNYNPQFFFLALYNCADGSAISSYLGTALSGEWVWKWKDGVDRAFVARFDVSLLGPSRSKLILPT